MLTNNSIEQQLSDGVDVDTPEGGRGCRNKKKQMDPACCPVCSVTLRTSEFYLHLNTELDKLSKLSSHKPRTNSKISTVPDSGPSASTDNSTNGWDTYQKVRMNRQSRLKVKSKKRKADGGVACPVCNKVTTDDLTMHVEMCLQRMEANGSGTDEDDTIDVEGGSFQEYEWAGQTRVRASSLLEGGFNGLNYGTSIKVTSVDEEVDVVVDDDDTVTYGPAHYTEQDIINASAAASRQQQLDQDHFDQHTDNNTNIETENDIDDDEDYDDETNQNKSTASTSAKFNNTEIAEELAKDVVIESLKLKIRDLEERNQIKDQYKCLICLGRYRNPVVSICCWHVHCEQCWLQTLATKKMCPQCNMITSVSELRRIFV